MQYPEFQIFINPSTTDSGIIASVGKKSKNYGCFRQVDFDGDTLVMCADWDFPISSNDVLVFCPLSDKEPFKIEYYRQHAM